MANKKQTTMDRVLSDSKRKKRFQKKYEAFLLSEALRETMNERELSVRQLAERSGISLTEIQGIRSGDKVNVTKSTLDSLFDAMGCSVAFLINDGEREFIVS